jgi:hypothetical protein
LDKKWMQDLVESVMDIDDVIGERLRSEREGLF